MKKFSVLVTYLVLLTIFGFGAPLPELFAQDFCEEGIRPISLTFQYTGGGCNATTNLQEGKFDCDGSITSGLAITVTTTNSGYTITPSIVNPSAKFTVTNSGAILDAESKFSLSNSGGTEELSIHTSCSAPLAVGDVFGSLTLEDLDFIDVNTCLELEKLVSGDGGVTFFDADSCSDADVPYTADYSVYDLIVTNCGKEAVELDRIIDQDLGINLVLDPVVPIPPGDSVMFTNDAGQTQGLLQKEDACPNADGEFDNTATVFGTGASSNRPVEATDPACVKCGPCIEILKDVRDAENHGDFQSANNCDDAIPISEGAEYRLTVKNCGAEELIDVVINDFGLGVGNYPVGALTVDETKVFFFDSPGSGIPELKQPELCQDILPETQFLNMSMVEGTGVFSTLTVTDINPACVKCEVDEDGDGVPDDQDECPDTVIPESVPTKKLGTNRFALVNGNTDFDTKAPKGKGPRKEFTIEDTAGCSCEQIIEELGLGNGHVKFGCSISAMEEWIDAVNAAPVLCDNIRPITKLILVWDGTGMINVTTELDQVINNIYPGNMIALDTEGAGNDLLITISGAIEGESTFHLSCSDEDMNGPEDCGKVQGNGKTSDPSLINDWLFAGIEGENGILECSP